MNPDEKDIMTDKVDKDEPEEAPDLIPPILKNEVLSPLLEPIKDKQGSEETHLANEMTSKLVLEEEKGSLSTSCTNLSVGACSDLNGNSSASTQVTSDTTTANVSDSSGYVPRGAYFYHNKPKF